MFIRVFTKKSRGFTLIEMLIAISISIIVAMILLLISTNGLKYVREIQQRQRLQAEADYLINKLAYLIRQGKQLNAVSSSELQITLPDSSLKIFIKTGDKIFLDGQSLLSNETKITNLVFTPKDRSVKIDLTLSQSIANLSIKTTLAQRN